MVGLTAHNMRFCRERLETEDEAKLLFGASHQMVAKNYDDLNWEFVG